MQRKKNKIPATAMFYALVLALVLLMSSLMFAYFHVSNTLLSDRAVSQSQLIRNTRSAVQLALHQPGLTNWDAPDGSVSKMNRSHWGCFEILSVSALNDVDTLSRLALVGNVPENNLGIYVSDLGRVLRISGETKLSGNSFLPQGRFERSTLGQSYFNGDVNMQELRESSRVLPKVASQIQSAKRSLMNDLLNAKPITTDSVNISFSAKAQHLDFGKNYELNHGAYRGRCILHAADTLVLGSGVVLENVILHANHIRFNSGFDGSVQAIATSIEVQEGANLSYPSALLVSGEEAWALIEENTEVNGLICTLGRTSELSIQPKARIHGEVYSEGRVQHEGSVEGALCAYQLIHNSPSSLQVNALLNGSVEGYALHPAFVGSPRESQSQKVMAWLN